MELAIVLLKSLWRSTVDDERTIENKLMLEASTNASDETISVPNDAFNIRTEPATTRVELWMRAETGVGPSIASSSQIWKKHWTPFDDELIVTMIVDHKRTLDDARVQPKMTIIDPHEARR